LVITIIISQINYSICQIRDPRPKDQATVFWNGSYPLYSLVSGQEIKPNSNGDYIFWGTTNEDPRPTSYNIKKGKSLTVYKFASFEECALKSKSCMNSISLENKKTPLFVNFPFSHFRIFILLFEPHLQKIKQIPFVNDPSIGKVRIF
jgi:hypothetical protein